MIVIDKTDLQQSKVCCDKDKVAACEYKPNHLYQEKLKMGLCPLLLQSADFIDHLTSHSYCAAE